VFRAFPEVNQYTYIAERQLRTSFRNSECQVASQWTDKDRIEPTWSNQYKIVISYYRGIKRKNRDKRIWKTVFRSQNSRYGGFFVGNSKLWRICTGKTEWIYRS